MRHTLLSKCQEVINQAEAPFALYNLSTHKIFKDLYDYHLLHRKDMDTSTTNHNPHTHL